MGAQVTSPCADMGAFGPLLIDYRKLQPNGEGCTWAGEFYEGRINVFQAKGVACGKPTVRHRCSYPSFLF
jgi:hypothetical protein